MRERVLFVGAAKQRRTSFTSLCATFGITPKTGYKWLNQFRRLGAAGLEERSRRPHTNNRAVSSDVAERFVALRQLHPTWGPRKLVAWLGQKEPTWKLPAPSTVGELLKQRGFITPPAEKARRRGTARTAPLRHATDPNRVWSMDFKGWFRLGDHTRCDPFTVTDNFSRFLLCCKAHGNQRSETVWRALAETFKEFGMPEAIRVDGGQPWSAPKGAIHLTSLSAKILRLGIEIERIAPGKPQENGRHERFHLTLQGDVGKPAQTLAAQQRRFKTFRTEYNDERPHEALGQRPPATKYRPSKRKFPSKLPLPEYPARCNIQRVDAGGHLRFQGNHYFLTRAIAGESVGLFEIEDGCFELRYCETILGHLHRAHPELGIVVSPRR